MSMSWCCLSNSIKKYHRRRDYAVKGQHYENDVTTLQNALERIQKRQTTNVAQVRTPSIFCAQFESAICFSI